VVFGAASIRTKKAAVFAAMPIVTPTRAVRGQYGPAPCWDVTHPQANKGAVVTTLSRLLNVPPDQIATIGGMLNEVLMCRKSGFSIAMSNASDEVRAQASAVTDSNANEGFAKAVGKFVLPSAAA
jgi:hydroxymethylpyrimidine pyrophosphatase-like HAD family hydrolase